MNTIHKTSIIVIVCAILLACKGSPQENSLNNEPIQAFCIDFNWSGKGYAGISLPEDFSNADPKTHLEWYKAHGVNTIQSFCVSHNGYAWYDSEIVPKVPGLKSDFLKELVQMGHKEGMKVMGYFSPGTNVRWLEEHPDEVYNNQGMFHIVYTSDYLKYLGSVIYEAITKTGIDGFMIDALFTAPRDSAEAMKWMPCEQKIYEELFGTPFPGKDKITYAQELEYKRRSTERCWDTIYQSAKRANPDCIVWLTCHDLTHPQIRPNSRIFKQADWLMSENSDAKYLKKIQNAIGPHTQLIQCISGWASHDVKSLMVQKDSIKRGWYGFAWPDSATTLPYTVESAKGNERFRQNAINIEEMTKFYKGEK